MIAYAMQFIGKPYIFGDKSPVLGGYDCSGYVCDILRFAGLVGKIDLNAQSLFDLFHVNGTPGVKSAGTLAFYGQSVTSIDHVAFMVDAFRILEAAGGDHTTTTIEEADRRHAMVRGRLLNYRADLVATVRPRYATIGIA